MKLLLPPDEVHLWLAFSDEDADARCLSKYRQVLSEGERLQEKRFRFGRDQRRYVVTRAFVRTVFSRYSGRTLGYWEFAGDAYGRPVLMNGEGIARSMSFNLSHTDGLIICAVSHTLVVGADVENFRVRPVALEIADRYFSSNEAAVLRALPTTKQAEVFFHYWTLKEAYIKAKGKGLSIPLNRFSFSFPCETGRDLSFRSELDPSDVAYRFWLLQPSTEHIAAVCVQRQSDDPQRLVIRRITPLGQEEAFSCSILLSSR